MYTIAIDSIIFNAIFEYIFKIDIYEAIEYKLPSMLEINVLIIFSGAFTIVPVANKIM